MPVYRTPGGGSMHIKFSGKLAKNPPAPCAALIPREPLTIGGTMRCCAISSFLCDWELSDGKTCDAPLCADHAKEIGRDRHYCPLHLAAHRDAEPDLF